MQKPAKYPGMSQEEIQQHQTNGIHLNPKINQEEIEKAARKLCESKGLDPDKKAPITIPTETFGDGRMWPIVYLVPQWRIQADKIAELTLQLSALQD